MSREHLDGPGGAEPGRLGQFVATLSLDATPAAGAPGVGPGGQQAAPPGRPRAVGDLPRWAVTVLVAVVLVGQLATLGVGVLIGRSGGSRRAEGLPVVNRGSSRVGPVREPPAPSSGSAADVPPDRGRSEGIRDAVAALSDAVRDRDRETFLAQVDARDAELLARWSRRYRNLTTLPIAVSFQWNRREVLQAVGHPDRPGAVTTAVDVEQAWTDWDSVPQTEAISLTLAPVAGRWVIVGDEDRHPGVERGLDFLPWSGGDVVAVRSRHALVIGEPARRDEATRLSRDLESVIRSVRQVWPGPGWDGTVVAYALSAPEFLTARLESNESGLLSVVSTDGEGMALRVLITPAGTAETPAALAFSLRWDVTAVATTTIGSGGPAWLRNGVIQYTAERRMRRHRLDAPATLSGAPLADQTLAAASAGTWRPDLIAGDEDWPTAPGESSARYDDAVLACMFVVETYGEPTLRRLYEVVAVSGDDPDVAQDAALRSVLHLSRAQFERRVTAYGRRLLAHAAADEDADGSPSPAPLSA